MTIKYEKSSKSMSVISIMVMCFILTTAVMAGTVMANEVSGEDFRIEVFNGTEQVDLHNKPFLDNGEIYLPLREVLNGMDVGNDEIHWDNDLQEVLVGFPDPTAIIYDPEVTVSIVCRITVDTYTMSVNGSLDTLTHPPMMKDDTVYVPIGVFLRIKGAYTVDENRNPASYGFLQNLKVVKYDSDGKKDVMISLRPSYTLENCYDPSTYYEPGEKVLIGTAKQQDEYGHYNPTDEVRNGKLIKRIIIDDLGEVVAVVPIENQLHETLDKEDITFAGANGWERAINSIMNVSDRERLIFSQPITVIVHESIMVDDDYKLEKTAYIPIEYQIKVSSSDVNAQN